MLLQLTKTLWIDVTKISYINSEKVLYGGVSQSKAKVVVDGQVMEINEIELSKIIDALTSTKESNHENIP